MHFSLFLFLLISLSFYIADGHPWGDLSHRHRRSDDETQDSHTTQKCYFSTKRTTAFEKSPRPRYSEVSESCSGKMIRISELMEKHFDNLYQCPNYAALIIARGEGRYGIDWTDEAQVEELGKSVVCAAHEDELGHNWDARRHSHYGRQKRTANRNEVPLCSMPVPFFQHEESFPLHHEKHSIEADEAKAILKLKGILIHPGLPVCAAHNKEAQNILAQYINEEAAAQNIVNSDNNDPNYMPHHRELPMDSALVSPPKFSHELKSAYATFMNLLGLDSWIAQKKNWNELDERNQRKKAEALSIASDAIAHMMAPQDPEALKAKAFKGTISHERPRPKEYTEMMVHVKKAFEYAETRAERIAALSMISHLHLSEIQKYIPGLSRYYHEEARKYAGRGYHLIKSTIRRVRYNKRKLNRALLFFTSPKVTIDSPFRSREVKDSYGKWIEIPNTIRALRVGEIYFQYKKNLESTGEMDQLVPESTFRKMLRICKAERRKSLHGVDIFSFDRADIAIQKMLEKNWISKAKHDSLRSEMLAGRQYLRTDYLAHGKEFSTTGDHCWSHGLSDPDHLEFQVDCQKESASWMHSHSRVCHQCENLQVFFENMRDTLTRLREQHKNDKKMLEEIGLLFRDLSDWEIKIGKLKTHQLRSSKSENDRHWLAAGLLPGDCLLTADWAMKFLELHPRERTSDWYAKRGIPWHIGHGLVFFNGEYYQHHFVHIFEGERQDSVAVTAILRSIFQQLATAQIRRVFLRSDQAGCYKSSSTISSMKPIAEEVGIEIVGWYFSEAQAGKGPCDRGASRVKFEARSYADSNHPVTNAKEFFHAMTREGRIMEGYSFHLVRLEGTGKDKVPKVSPSKIPDLSLFNAFTFEEDAIRVHRYWNIGKGKTIPYTNLIANDGILIESNAGGALSGDHYWQKLGEPRKPKDHSATEGEKEKEPWEDEEEQEDEESVCEKDAQSRKCKEKKALASALYQCPVESCSKEFLSEKGLEKHMTVGRHLRRPERENVEDYALHQFTSFIEMVHPPQVCPLIDDAITSLVDDNENAVHQKMGWALPKRKRSTRFPPAVKEFLKKIYDDGEISGAKTDPRGAEEMMRVATKPGGGMLFDLNDLLTSRQIAGVYKGFKHTKLKARKKAEQKHKRKKLNEDEEEEMELDEEEIDEVNQLFETEGDEELEYDTEPLFDEEEAMRRGILESDDIYKSGDGDDDDDDDESM